MGRVTPLLISIIAVLGGLVMFTAMMQIQNIYISIALPFLFLYLTVVFFSLDWKVYTLIFVAPIMVVAFRFDMTVNYMSKFLAYLLACPKVYILFVPTIVAGWILHKMSNRMPTQGASIINSLWVSLLIWSAFTYLWAPNPIFCFIQFSLFAIHIFMFYFTVHAINNSEQLDKAISAFIFTAFIFSVAAIGGYVFAQYKRLQDITDYFFEFQVIKDILYILFEFRVHPRRAGLLAHPNQTGCLMNIAVACLLYRIVRGKGSRSRNIFLLILMAVSVFLTQSKACLLILLMVGVLFLVINEKIRSKAICNSVLWGMMIISAFILIQVTVNKSVLDRIAGTSSVSTMKEDSLSIRFEWWKKGFRYLNDNSRWMGLGPGGFKAYMTKDNVPYAHSIYFSILFDMGIPGFLLLLVIIFSYIKRFYVILTSPELELYEMALLLSVILLIVGIHGIIDFEYNSQFLWPIMGFVTAGLILAENELKAQNICRYSERQTLFLVGNIESQPEPI
jgi:O-antigen ligase